ncbi:uncharacterized protein B0H64DRAFT_392025 [Chaetomium fimeti]|uniref:F-box domain-containing protein n=1 Tax=Chaetomium fimeti TaxID=1854472 RepID=A0AAE0HJE7_9PEZI|nr:hypothetical protein B0H64DRAFT_392025 [Chaetomium fimeti]
MSEFPESQMSPLPNMTLLRLSKDTRHRIYRYLGLASWDGQPYTFALNGGTAEFESDFKNFNYAPYPNLFHGLLLCCRDLYAEAAALLYSTNLFILHYSDPTPPRRAGARTSFQALCDLTPSALLSLSHLKIVINESACHQRVIEDRWVCCLQGNFEYAVSGISCWKGWHDDHQSPLLSPPSTDDHHGELAAAHSVLTDWHSAAIHLLSHVTPGRLALSLVCDIDPRHPQALDIAEGVVGPLRRLPRSYLRECNIRLATPFFHAVGAAATPISNPSSNTATTLTALPRELRIRILEYTDLITPTKDVIWTREHRAYTVAYLGWRAGDPQPSYGSQFFSCGDETNINRGNLERTVSGCFCRLHAAFSFTCRCWAPPGPALFLVCRALCDDARFVFFSGNRFTVPDHKLNPPWVLPVLGFTEHSGAVPTYPYPFERFAASDFLRNVVPTCALAHLRFLDLMFPPYRPGSWPEKQHPVMQDWWATVDWLRGKIDPPALTLRLAVSQGTRDTPSPYYRSITKRDVETLVEAYLHLSQPLAALGNDGLARFYARLPVPWECTDDSVARYRSPDDVHGDDTVKERVERYVMGDRYESLYANGKKEPDFGDIYKKYCHLE